MGKFYGEKIRRGERTIKDVPKLWKVATERWLAENQNKFCRNRRQITYRNVYACIKQKERYKEMQDFLNYISEVWPGWACTVLFGVVTYLYTQVMASRNGVRALLKAEIIRVYNKYHDNLGYCPIYVKQSIEDIYKQYHLLKGNGVGTRLYDEIMALPTERPEEG